MVAAGAPAAPAAAARPVAPPPGPPAWLDEVPAEEEYAAPAVREAPPPPFAVASRGTVDAPAWQATPLGERWAAIVALLEQRQLVTALVRELAVQAELLEQQDGATPLWRLRVERESLRSTPLRDKLQAALAEALGITTLTLEVVAGTVQDTPARRAAAERQRRQHEAEQIIHNDPLVLEMLAQFKTARIVPGSIKPQ